MNLQDKFKAWMNERTKLAISVISENDMNIVGVITNIGDDFIEVSGKSGVTVIQINKIGYVRIHQIREN
jgi:hypothetical protein